MKVALAQIPSDKGNVEANLQRHLKWAQLAAQEQVDLLVFPELSLTGYFPSLVGECLLQVEDERLKPLQEVSDAFSMTICVGAPTGQADAVRISTLIFQPQKSIGVYHKHYLHQDELPFFVPGEETGDRIDVKPQVALAVCFEMSVPQHADKAYQQGAEIYVCSVVKDQKGVLSGNQRMQDIQAQTGMQVLMCNAVGESEDYPCTGQSASLCDGEFRALSATETGLLIAEFDL